MLEPLEEPEALDEDEPFDALAPEGPDPPADAPLLAPLSPPCEHALPVTASLPFTQFWSATEERDDGVAGVAGVAGIAAPVLLREAEVAGVAGVAGVAAFDTSFEATFADFFEDLSCDAVLSLFALFALFAVFEEVVSFEVVLEPSVLAIVELPLGVVLLAEAVVSAEIEPLVEPLREPLVEASAEPLNVPELVLPVELPLAGLYVFGLAPVELLLGAVGVAVLACCLDFWRSPIASALALPSAKMEIKNTGASLRIWVSFKVVWLDRVGGELATPRCNRRATR